jgi:hypothetical protein
MGEMIEFPNGVKLKRISSHRFEAFEPYGDYQLIPAFFAETVFAALAQAQADKVAAVMRERAEAVQAERWACALICDGYGREGERVAKEYAAETADEIAARIRARAALSSTGAGDGWLPI